MGENIAATVDKIDSRKNPIEIVLCLMLSLITWGMFNLYVISSLRWLDFEAHLFIFFLRLFIESNSNSGG